MSRPGPYQGEPGRQQPYGRQQYPPQGYQQQSPYGQPYQEQPYRQPGPPQRPPSSPPPRYSDDDGFRFRLPGLGLLLSLVGIVVQLLCMLVLPWVSASAAGGDAVSLPELWKVVSDVGAQGFGGWYVALFSYPLAVLGVVLALVSVLESVAGKVIFAGLAIIGIGWLLLRYGVGPAAGMFGESGGFSRQEITTIGIAVAALVVVIFMLRTGLAMFRRIAGLVLLVIAGVHVYAVQDLVDGADGLSIGAYGPALGYVLSGVAALIGPRRLTPG